MNTLKSLRYSSLILALFFSGCGGASNSSGADIATPQPINNNTPVENQVSEHPVVQMDTSMGTFTIELYPEEAPKTVDNFLTYVKSGHYDGTIFHRVIPGFMVQGGGMNADMSEKSTNAPIEIEADNGLKNDEGTVAMARTQDPNSATSQFFVNVADNGFLNHTGKNMQGWGYTVFGKVTEGMDVIKQIEKVPTGNHGMHGDVPKEPVVINSATVVSE